MRSMNVFTGKVVQRAARRYYTGDADTSSADEYDLLTQRCLLRNSRREWTVATCLSKKGWPARFMTGREGIRLKPSTRR